MKKIIAYNINVSYLESKYDKICPELNDTIPIESSPLYPIFTRLNNSNSEAKEDSDYANTLLTKLMYGNKDSFFQQQIKIHQEHLQSYLTLTGRELIKGLAHIMNVKLDLNFSYQQTEFQRYYEQGYLSSNRKLTSKVEELPDYQRMKKMTAQISEFSQSKMIGLMLQMVMKVKVKSPHLSPKLECMIQVLKELGRIHKFFKFTGTIQELRTTSEKQIKDLLSGNKNELFLPAGSFKHAYYVKVCKRKNEPLIDIVIYNFNQSIINKQFQIKPKEDDFRPFIITFKKTDSKTDIPILADYIQLIVASSKKQKKITVADNNNKFIPEVTKVFKEHINELVETFGPLLFIDDRLNLTSFTKDLTSQRISSFLSRHITLDRKRKRNEKKLKSLLNRHLVEVSQRLQILLFNNITHHPELFWKNSFDSNNTKDNPRYGSYSLQQSDNCTSHNLKALLYNHADITQADRLKYNVELNFSLIQIIKETKV